MLQCMSPLLAPFETYRRTSKGLFIEVNRKWSAGAQNDAIDALQTLGPNLTAVFYAFKGNK